MTEHIQFHFNGHPVIAFIIMLFFLTCSFLMNIVDYAHAMVPFAQIAACLMTLIVGYKTLKNQKK